MGKAVSAIAFPVSTVVYDGPNNAFIRYEIKVPSGTSASTHFFAGPIDVNQVGPDKCALGFHVSVNPSAADTVLVGILGTLSEPSTTPTGRTWIPMRGDASGAGVELTAVTCGGHVRILTRARSYLVRVCSVTKVSDPVTLRFLTVNEAKRSKKR